MSHFGFLAQEWPLVHEAAVKAEQHARTDAQTACFYARRALELLVDWLYSADRSLSRPYRDDLNALIHEPSFRRLASDGLFTKADLLRRLGNKAVHDKRAPTPQDGVVAARELFHLCYWMARTYARKGLPDPKLVFDPSKLPMSTLSPEVQQQTRELIARYKERGEELAGHQQTIAAQATELETIKAELERIRGQAVADRARALANEAEEKSALKAELARLREEVAEAKEANQAKPDTHDYNEQETRDAYIDLMLAEAGWKLGQGLTHEHPVKGMPNASGQGAVDYVLWGDDGKALAIVEAKRTRYEPAKGKHQAKLYADLLQESQGQRPIIFLSNGYQHFLWDDLAYPPREVQGFYNKDQLQLLIWRRTSQKPLDSLAINDAIVERSYQHRAIRRVCETFEQDRQRRALLVMATGSGKTRTTIALIDLLMRCNWVRRVLFLADRTELVTQARNEMAKHLPDVPPVNLLTEKSTDGRVYVSTYQTMMNLISDGVARSRSDDTKQEEKRFSVGYFDLVVIDEAHRSVFQKYRAIFDYFDSLLLGLTATPKDEIDRNTYSLFQLETGVPTDAYTLDEAVKEGYLVPPRGVSLPLKFPREGIRYNELSGEDKERWEELEWEDDQAPTEVAGEAVNTWFFNASTVDLVLEHLMTHGLKVAGGDRLGKTIIFAKNSEHARFIAQRFDANYPHYKGHFAQVITYEVDYAHSLIANFKKPEESPHIAISVDMLDTGVDVPEVVNLVFFKAVRSKTKFWQMVGRGTRLAPDLFGPGQSKTFFNIFDICGNLEYFSQNLDRAEAPVAEALSTRLFKARLQLLTALPAVDGGVREDGGEESIASVRMGLMGQLQEAVGSMNTENFVVRPLRKTVEKYTESSVWDDLGTDECAELETLSELPTELESEPEETKRFDLVILRLQLGLLKGDRRFPGYQQQVQGIAEALLEKISIPMVKEREALLHELSGDQWWRDVTVPMLESARKTLRGLVGFVEKIRRTPLYTDIADTLGPVTEIELSGLTLDSFSRFRQKTQAYLRQNLNHLSVHKLHTNQQLTQSDLEELERMLLEAGVGAPEHFQEAVERSQGLGLFVRSLVGLERKTARDALSGFIAGRTLSANQLHFLEHMVEHLTCNGTLEVGRLYDAPFTDRAPQGPEQLWGDDGVDALDTVLQEITSRAVA